MKPPVNEWPVMGGFATLTHGQPLSVMRGPLELEKR